MAWQFFDKFSDATVYFLLAAVGTTLFLIKLGLMIFGGGHGDVGHDVGGGDVHVGDMHHGGDAHHGDSDASFNLLSVQSVLGFFMGAGWMGLAGRLEWDWTGGWTFVAAVAFGLAMMVLSAALSYYMRRLDASPTAKLDSCVGSTGKVYLTIPARGQGSGQVEVNVSGRRKIVEAASQGGAIAAFTVVNILAVEGDRRVIVEPRA